MFHVCDQIDLEAASNRAIALSHIRSAIGEGFEDERTQIAELISLHEDIAERTCRPGHLTGSAFVLDATGSKTALLFHTKLQRWLQPGGHADGDTNLLNVAFREATEETGIEGLRAVSPAIDIDIHRVEPPKEDPHLHLDVRFLMVAQAGAELQKNHESQQLKWVPIDQLSEYGLDMATMRMADAAVAAFEHLCVSGVL